MAKLTTERKSEDASTVKSDNQQALLFGKVNYILVFTGILLIAIGFALMAGGGSDDPAVFDAEAIYSFRRITLAPMFVLAGFIVEIVAILKKP